MSTILTYDLYWMLAQVFVSMKDSRSHKVVKDARTLIQSQASTIPYSEIRETFLQQDVIRRLSRAVISI